MRIALLLAAGMMVALISPARAASIGCGAVLGPGGRYTLDHDLVCPPTFHSDDNGIFGVLNVLPGATLNLKGHTVSCLPPPSLPAGGLGLQGVGIWVFDGTLKNGTVRGCLVGVYAVHFAVVKGMVAEGNVIGFQVLERHDCCPGAATCSEAIPPETTRRDSG